MEKIALETYKEIMTHLRKLKLVLRNYMNKGSKWWWTKLLRKAYMLNKYNILFKIPIKQQTGLFGCVTRLLFHSFSNTKTHSIIYKLCKKNYVIRTLHFTLPCPCRTLNARTRVRLLGTSNYNENLQIFLKIAESDTQTRIPIGNPYPSPSNIKQRVGKKLYTWAIHHQKFNKNFDSTY